MMAISLFCQDAREEMGGIVSLMGLLPDNIQVDSLPGAMPKLVVFTRINLELTDPAIPIEFWIKTPEGEEIAKNIIDVDLVQKALSEAQDGRNSIAGLVSRVEGSPFPAVAGRFLAIIKYDGREYITGSISFAQNSGLTPPLTP